MVDLNMGRPNGSLSYYCWRARQTDPHHAVDDDARGPAGGARRTLALVASTYCAPADLHLAPFAASLRAHGLLWDPTRGDGIILAQHLPGAADGGTVLAASWDGTDAERRLLDAFQAHAGFGRPCA